MFAGRSGIFTSGEKWKEKGYFYKRKAEGKGEKSGNERGNNEK